jgi:ClpP class serine protease
MRYIDIQDAEEVIRAIQETDPQTPIDLILHTPGGLALPSLQIARALARHPAPVSAYVPHYAMSGGTLIALAADRIVMCEHAVLGPIDPQIEGYPAASILRAVARKDDKDIDDTTLILADQAEMAMTQLRRAVEALLQPQLQPQVAEYAAGALSERQWTHDYPITPGSACR